MIIDNKNVIAFLPCREGSKRILNKNIKQFSSYKKGLVEIKLKQLLLIDKVSKIVISTNDRNIIDFANSLNEKKIFIDVRSEKLCDDQTSTDSLIRYVSELLENENILWTHVTSPFINNQIYDLIIEKYFEVLERGFDSLMTVTALKKFIWDIKGPINYDSGKEKWPRTQTLEPLYEINSAAFLAHKSIYKKFNNRVGQKPYLYEIDQLSSFDIDWQDDWIIAERILSEGIRSV
ncbi:acylneuraminate cytidylyltransferase family protein [Prochlorococcus marinus XMU1414]|uniref:Acylneuraminate cytidylyltransferase family protein n=1 Tax=Prochlorococcus marinus XMU1424 TaxID=2774497 RepID=A0A9D9BTI4_PROMR|nr:acylneuraminate cytidylyltransferase family protein [Prochlorococcus marinus]MBO8228680.1 acylneuraminate cytidylyltransferase family protein [Prochlorococcus marinus XMU1414]MBW3046159.1 acylneuraminate cytidylyltransferase [Prochlorococcus marinus str. MU1414]MCR8531549.1 acylneuraminate cytidylyltransferase family protein [Prochlorococcus marinus XMU1420]MCR8535278.1 acylneuraminate cytidylyltransferase family protein [Prochlorococcus marinus XMU1424]